MLPLNRSAAAHEAPRFAMMPTNTITIAAHAARRRKRRTRRGRARTGATGSAGVAAGATVAPRTAPAGSGSVGGTNWVVACAGRDDVAAAGRIGSVAGVT